MVEQGPMKRALRRLDQIVRELATENGWQPEDYKLFVWVNDGQYTLTIHLFLEAKWFPGATYFEQWDRVLSYIEAKIKDDRQLRSMLHLVIQTFEQTAKTGTGVIAEPLVPIEEWIGPTALA